MTYEEIRQNEAVNTYIRQADAALATLGFTEHSFAHVTLVAEKAGYILQTLRFLYKGIIINYNKNRANLH